MLPCFIKNNDRDNMQITTSYSSNQYLAQSVEQLALQLRETKASGASSTNFLIFYINQQHEAEPVVALLKQHFPNVKFIGCTSCQGVMCNSGHHEFNQEGEGIGLMSLSDAQGVFGTGLCHIQLDTTKDSAKLAGKKALMDALQDSGRAGELPAFVLLHSSPGFEEAVLEGMRDIFGDSVPIVGGSAADDFDKGQWLVFCSEGASHTGVAVAVCYPSCEVALSFYSGYDPSEYSGMVTKTEGREIISIDHKPAAEVYHRWTGGLGGTLLPGNNILRHSSLTPLGRRVDTVAGYPFYILSHPEIVTDSQGLRLFSKINEGERIYLMLGNKPSLITRGGRVIKSALDGDGKNEQKTLGALIIFCAGYMLTVQDEMEQVVDNIDQCLNGVPFLGAYTFGEQGMMPDHCNGHGNLMVSALLFLDENS